MFNQTRHNYFDFNGQKMDLYSKLNSKIENIFGNNGAHAHLNMDVGMEQFLEKHKVPYQNSRMMRDLKSYVDMSLKFQWIKPIILRTHF